jgi:5-methylcytosine-specific restriction endonuclease McrA
VRAVSKKRARENRGHAAIREAVFERDGYRCQLGHWSPCFGPLTPHHRRKASQGGRYTLENLTALCSSHNDQLEADPVLAAYARSIGLVLRREDVA